MKWLFLLGFVAFSIVLVKSSNVPQGTFLGVENSIENPDQVENNLLSLIDSFSVRNIRTLRHLMGYETIRNNLFLLRRTINWILDFAGFMDRYLPNPNISGEEFNFWHYFFPEFFVVVDDEVSRLGGPKQKVHITLAEPQLIKTVEEPDTLYVSSINCGYANCEKNKIDEVEREQKQQKVEIDRTKNNGYLGPFLEEENGEKVEVYYAYPENHLETTSPKDYVINYINTPKTNNVKILGEASQESNINEETKIQNGGKSLNNVDDPKILPFKFPEIHFDPLPNIERNKEFLPPIRNKIPGSVTRKVLKRIRPVKKENIS